MAWSLLMVFTSLLDQKYDLDMILISIRIESDGKYDFRHQNDEHTVTDNDRSRFHGPNWVQILINNTSTNG